MENNKQLKSLSKAEHWKVLRKTMEDIAKKYYGWNREDIEISKGAHLFLEDVIRKVEGAKDSED